jgi:hypothetical protein
MAGSVQATPGFNLQPSAQQVPLATNYITDFNFLNQYLPDTYEKEFERYGNRTVSSFLRMVGAEMPSNSDLIKWAEQGRLHTKYVNCTSAIAAAATTVDITVNDVLVPNRATVGLTAGSIAVRVGQTVMLTPNAGSSVGATANKGVVTIVGPDAVSGLVSGQFRAAIYEAGGITKAAADVYSMFIYGSEFAKGTNGMVGSLEADDEIFETSPIILKDKYAVSGSDMAQIGWVEVTTENGANGYLWYLKSEHETRLRFDDYLETAMIEAVPADVAGAGSGAATAGYKGSEGIFYSVEDRGNVWAGGNPSALADFDNIIRRLDKQGSIEENVIFLNREFGFDIDDMLATQNSYGAGGTSYGLFDNDKDMALNLGFTGFRRGYDFYKTDWKYLNDPTMRGGLTGAGSVNGLLVPAGSTTVYDQVLGKNAKRPWITGSAGGANNSDLDAMEVHFLSERAVCTLGANNFFIFKD